MEKKIETYLCKSVKAAGGRALKLVCPGTSGVPDRLILLPGGRAFFAETKDAGKKPTEKQKYRHQQLRALGFRVYVPDNTAAVDEMLRIEEASPP